MSVNSQNFAIAVAPLKALTATTGAATTLGTSIDLEAVPAADEVGFIGVADIVGTSALFKVQASSDGTNWYDIPGAASPVLTAAGAYPISIGRSRLQSLIQAAGSNTALNARYVRLAAVTVGSTTVVWGVYSPFKLKQFPVNGYVNCVNYTLLGD